MNALGSFSFSVALIFASLSVFAAGQAPQLDVRYLDEMEDVGEWNALASDGVSVSVHAAKGVEGNALVLEYNLNRTAGYAAAASNSGRIPGATGGGSATFVTHAGVTGIPSREDR